MPEKPTYEELEHRVRELERTLAQRAEAQGIPAVKGGDNVLRENERKYRLMVENANEAILVAQDGVFVFSNPMGETLFGYSKRELGSRPLVQFVHEADRQMVGERHERRLDGDTSIPDVYPFRIIHGSGDIRWVNLKVALFSWEGRPATLCFMTDITKRKRAEEALRESEAVMRYIIQHDPNAIAVYDRDLRYLAVSDRYLRDYGIAGREILGEHHYEVFPDIPERWKEVHRRVLRGAVEKNDDDGFQRPDGFFTYNRWECRPWYRADGSIGGMITYTEVTTERKLAEQDLKRSEERFRRIVETAEEGIWLVDRKWETEFLNDRMAEMLGYQPEEILGRHLLSFMDEQEQSRARELMARREQGVNEKHDFKFQRRDGADLWAIVSTNAVISEDGQFMHALAMVTDITERKQAEEALRESEKRYRMVVQDQTEVISRFLPDGTFSFVNQVYCDFFGKKEHELLGNRWTPVAHPDDVEMIQSKLAEISPANPVIDIENRVYSGKGRLHWFRFVNRGFFDSEGRLSEIQSVGRDITDRKRAEQALKESEERHKKISVLATDYFYELRVDEESRISIEWVSDSFERVTTYTRDEMKAFEKWMLKIHPDDLADLQQKTADLLANKPVINEYRFENRNGDIRWLVDRLIPEWSEKENRVVKVYGAVRDITDRKHAEAAIAEAHESLSATLDALPDILFEVDSTGRIYDYHAPKDDMLYVRPELFLNKTFSEVLPPHVAEVIEQTISEALAKGKHYGTSYVLDLPSGPNWYELSVAVKTKRNKHSKDRLIVLARNITDRKRAEADLQKSLAEKEVLLREIHHRVKNNMQVIISLLRMHARKDQDSHLKAIFDECRDRIEAMSLIHEALYQSDDLSRIDFESYLKKLCRNLAQAHDARRKNITLTSSAADVTLNMDQGIAVGMIIAELISNAFKHAFPSGRSGNATVGMTKLDAETVELTVADDGKGLPPDFALHGNQSLGMRLVSGAVTRELGGSIDAESDNGARFIIRFKCENGK